VAKVTGGMTSMGLKSINGTYLQDEWKAAANTYLGTTISGYPNMFHMYGPHGPTLLSNGPSSVEIQTRWIRDAINKVVRQNIKYINPTKEASDKWKQRIEELAKPTLFPTTRSTYMGGVSDFGDYVENLQAANDVSHRAFPARRSR
jgi:cation diffusion facilitator CzcD-associated flavoprotein CzcO